MVHIQHLIMTLLLHWLTDCPQVTGNFATVTRMLLAKIPATDGKMTYIYDDFQFHYISEDGISYLCMSDEKNKHRVPYAFLQDMKDRFLATYGLEAAQLAIAFQFNEEFSKVICERMGYYNSGGAADSIDTLKSQIDEVKDGMVQNIEKILERGEKIELLVDKTDRLNQQAYRFESSSRNLRRHIYWRKMRNVGICSVVVLLVIFFFAVGACGGFDFHRCSGGSK